MSALAITLAAVLETQVPPGRPGYSVEPAPSGRYSSFYGTTVRRETAETARKRYADIAAEIVESADEILAETGSKKFTRVHLVALAAGVAIIESGLREDVQVGRGWAKKADDVGGRGRGPGQEACLAQIHPLSAWRFPEPDVDPALLKRASKGEWRAQKAIADTLVGRDREALGRCFRTQARMLVHGAERCAGKSKVRDLTWGTIALYVSGSSCTTPQGGKTAARYRLANKIEKMLTGAAPLDVVAATPIEPAKSCSAIPYKYQRPEGWKPVAKRTRAQALWAHSLLKLPLDSVQETKLEGEHLLARVETHCDERRGPHRGVSLYRRETQQ